MADELTTHTENLGLPVYGRDEDFADLVTVVRRLALLLDGQRLPDGSEPDGLLTRWGRWSRMATYNDEVVSPAARADAAQIAGMLSRWLAPGGSHLTLSDGDHVHDLVEFIVGATADNPPASIDVTQPGDLMASGRLFWQEIQRRLRIDVGGGIGWQDIAVTPPLVTTLPTIGLYDGMVVDFLADASTPTIWRLRYRKGSTFNPFDWEFVGGSNLVAQVPDIMLSGSQSKAGDAQLVVPLRGTFEVTINGLVSGGGRVAMTARNASDQPMTHTDYGATPGNVIHRTERFGSTGTAGQGSWAATLYAINTASTAARVVAPQIAVKPIQVG